MKITSINVTAGRTFNHPYEDYSNLRPELKLTAELEEGEDPVEAVRNLQARAEGLMEDHKNSMLKNLEELHHLSQAQAEAQGLENSLRRSAERLDALRKEHPAAFEHQAQLEESTEETSSN